MSQTISVEVEVVLKSYSMVNLDNFSLKKTIANHGC